MTIINMEEIYKIFRKNKKSIWEISNFGNVKKNSKLHLPKTDSSGYLTLGSGVYVHRLVGLYFIDNPYNKEQINHLDGVKSSNHYSNLEWATRSENMKHAFVTGLQNIDGSKNPNSKLTSNKIQIIKDLRSKGNTLTQIANVIGVTPMTVWHFLKGNTYQKEKHT